MFKFQNYFCFLIIIQLTSCSESTDQKKEIQDSYHIDITSKNPKAIEFYREAELYEFNQEFVEARESYLSALRLDPNMVMALIGINESNCLLKSGYIKKAVEKINDANDYERIYIAWDTLPNSGSNRLKKQELSAKVIELYPDKVDGYMMMARSFSTTNDESIKFLEKVLEIDPNNLQANYQIIRNKFGGSNRVYQLKNDKSFFDSFDSIAKSLIRKFPKSLRIQSTLANLYRNSYDFNDETRIETAKKLYDNCFEIVNKNGSSSKVNLLSSIAKLNLQMGEREESFKIFRSAIDIAEENMQIIGANFRIFLAYLYEGDYLSAVKEINNFENSLVDSGFTEEEILKCEVGLANYKAIIYAHANQKERALEALNSYKKFSTQLIDLYGFKGDIDSQIKSLPGFNFIRWKEASPMSQLWNEIWVNILVGEHQKAETLQDKYEKNYGNRLTHWEGVSNILQGNTEKGYNILERNTYGYMQYFKSQALISLGEREKAKKVLDSVRQLPEGSIYNNLIVKRSSDLYKSL